ncbi:MBL fold metallo-hydrolase [Rhodocytophaga aerolata]|uniref:MBL fold metallo-hydrolase n=1 Tax=Rhodocytophaga aerolata TaxID=455078 RepID=A0ABT8RFZ7_9BACT|nr:MBL fold metallo-hydrolase [Rhodocytophaga aerolata]MDO1449637.1 MBL fold metallo-hydrolase [Rhodocytophaga aerolata]
MIATIALKEQNMFSKDYELTLSFFDVGGGDAILIRFLGNDSKWHNILIDGGYGRTYKDVFGLLLRSLPEKEIIDLWIITHIDIDHIGAVQGFIQDKKITDKRKTVKQFWFNHSPLTVKEGNGKVGVSQGVSLRAYLQSIDLLVKEAITTDLLTTDLWGLKITILSPTVDKLKIAQEKWQAKEHSGKLGRKQEQADHKKTIEELHRNEFTEDADPWNGSSIACLLEYKGHLALLLADSHPSVIIDSLKRLYISPESPLKVSVMQLAHHGSKANTCTDLLNLVKSANYVITGNGITNRHPDKETLVRVLRQKERHADQLEFIFPAKTDALANLFSVDEEAFAKHRFCCKYPEPGNNHISLKFLPIEESTL